MTNPSPNDEELIGNVLHSTKNALLALKQLEQSLIAGRFKEGLVPYEIMCKTLVGQRIWTLDKNHSQIDENFLKISQTAQSIIEILQPYIHNLQKVTPLDDKSIFHQGQIKQEPNTQPQNDTQAQNISEEGQKIIKLLLENSKYQISYTKLRSTLGWPKKKLDKILHILDVNFEAINYTSAGSRKFIVLRESFIQETNN